MTTQNYDTRDPYTIKSEICEIGRRIWLRGYCNGNEGNHSVRVGPDRVLCTPTGISKGFLEPEDVCLVNMEGEQVEENPNGRKRTSEVKVHLAIYKHRPDVTAVVHSHPPHATAFAVAGIPLPEAIHPEAEVFLGRVPMAHYATPSKVDLPNSIIPLIGPDTNTVLMGNHGSVNFAETLVDTYYKLEILDGYCRILLLAKQLGKANVLSPEQMTELLQVKQQFGLQDPRLACAPEGCIGAENEQFLAGFGVRPMSARTDGDGAPTKTTDERVSPQPVAPTPNDPSQMEALVQTITDQILQSMGR
jgi:L-fuculose-phosphate aldolase